MATAAQAQQSEDNQGAAVPFTPCEHHGDDAARLTETENCREGHCAACHGCTNCSFGFCKICWKGDSKMCASCVDDRD